MKKIIIFFVIILIIISSISYIYLNYKSDYNMAKKANLQFEKYLNKEVYGTDIATAINKAIDNNTKNEIEKNNKGIGNTPMIKINYGTITKKNQCLLSLNITI